MALLKDVSEKHEIVIQGDPPGRIVLREPTDEEWSRFENDRVKFRRGKADTSGAVAARVALFDACVVSVENVETEKVPVTIENIRQVIPARVKSGWIAALLENIRDGKPVDEDPEKD